MNSKTIIYYLPRFLSIVLILYISLFSLDVFGEYTGWELLIALFMHLMPTFLLIGVIVVAWKRDLVGAIAYFILGFGYILMAGFDRPWSWYVFISGPAFLVGTLFLISWFQKKKL
ncbi:MAG: hypothetical protein PHT67_02985 [Candidatus Pacebacteria bacterium]|nr:hypothetical protein [Candidatus Paceibacterota bacterium]MDD5013162.1 hypothetical protein [Candidatus Paceibacterota bacterium]